MCGIIHVKRNDGKLANKLVLKRYNKQRTRGSQGFGFIEINDGVVGAEVRTETEKEIKQKLLQSKASEIMFHHRFPTSTPNFIEATHPILVSHPSLKFDYYVMHNGIISNDTELYNNHIEQGFTYRTKIVKKFVTNNNVYSELMFNDSECMAIDFCLAIEQGTKMNSKGSIALVAIQFRKKSRKVVAMYYGRNYGNPLCIEDNKDFFALSSETGKTISVNTLFRIDYKTGERESRKFDVGRYTTSYDNSRDYTGGDAYGLQDWDDTPRPYSNPSDFDDEDDFCYDLYEEQVELEQDLRVAQQLGDYDEMYTIESRLEELRVLLAPKVPNVVKDAQEIKNIIGF